MGRCVESGHAFGFTTRREETVTEMGARLRAVAVWWCDAAAAAPSLRTPTGEHTQA
jgi:hypothetical protein